VTALLEDDIEKRHVSSFATRTMAVRGPPQTGSPRCRSINMIPWRQRS
jgi:hypothetical protein